MVRKGNAAAGCHLLKLIGLALLSLMDRAAQGQATGRVLDHNALGWFTYNGDHQLHPKWAVHTEGQWRRTRLGRGRQQLLTRLGLVYSLAEQVQLSGGYTHLTTYPYGDYPAADLSAPIPEHRLYEDVSLASSYGPVQLTHRLRLEQRWLGQLTPTEPDHVAQWQYQNRARYQLAGQVPLRGPRLDDGELYATFFDELFISFGPNVGLNVFNQNRLSGGLGYQLRKNWQVELSYLNQWLQHATPAPGTSQAVFEHNNGFRLNVIYNLDFTKSAP